MDAWDLSGQRAAANRERAAAFKELVRQFNAWIRARTETRAPQLTEHDCVGADC
jgi:hypothetical protein